MVGMLLKRGANPNLADESGATALMWSVPDRAKVQHLLDVRRDGRTRDRSQAGRLLLVAASYPGTVDLLQLLLARGADLRAEDRGGNNRPRTSRTFCRCRRRALPGRARSQPGHTQSRSAARSPRANYRPTIDYLISKGLGVLPDELFHDRTWEAPELLARAIDAGADVNASNAAHVRQDSAVDRPSHPKPQT
jgi:hypothetical protein